MPWKIEDSVVRGEVDNRQKGRITGRLWLHDRAEPLELDLQGNACPDLAGCRLTFENHGRTYPLPRETAFQTRQVGSAGDLTASRKVHKRPTPPAETTAPETAPDPRDAPEPPTPFPDAEAALVTDPPAARTVANGLYLEWYSEAEGRVVLEATDYRMHISPPSWRLTPEEESQRQIASAAAFASFLEQLTGNIERLRHEPPKDRVWDEFDYEKLLRESDARTDKLTELYEKYGDRPDLERIIAREMGWTWLEEALEHEPDRPGSSDLELDPDLDPDLDPESADLDPDPATEGVDWVRTDDGYPSHPLSLRVFESSLDLRRQCEEAGRGRSEDPAVDLLISEFQITGAKLAGALNGLAYGRELQDGAFVVATLKRALSHLHRAQEGLAAVTNQKLLPPQLCDSTRTEFFAVREEILRLMQEFRGHPRTE
jgi:hypothetical protein